MNQNENKQIRIAFCQAIGVSHLKEGIKCQDALCVYPRNGQREDTIVVIADGLGSLQYSEEAASAVVIAVKEFLRVNGPMLNEKNAAELLRQPLLDHARDAIAKVSQGRPMDCNLAFVAIFGEYAYIGHLGDCAVCILDDKSRARTTPSAIANATRTVLTASAEDLKIEVIPLHENINGFILTTDGLEEEIYRKSSGWINKRAEEYYNDVVSAPDQESANRMLHRKIAALQEKQGDFFVDDITIVVISLNGKQIKLEKDPTWRCLCGTRNQINALYCSRCKQDRLKIYPHDELVREGCENLDLFAYELEKDPEREQKYLERAALRLGALPPPPPQPRIPVSQEEPKFGAKNPDEGKADDSEAAPKYKRERRNAALKGDKLIGMNINQEKNCDEPTVSLTPTTSSKPALTGKKQKHGLRWIAGVACVVLLALAAAGIARLFPSGGEIMNAALSELESGYLGEEKNDMPHGIGVRADGNYLWIGIYENGEVTDEALRVDSIGILGPNGKYVYRWQREQEPGETEPQPSTTAAPTETTEPVAETQPVPSVAPTEQTKPDDPGFYPAGTTFTVCQTLKKGRLDPKQSNLTTDLNLKTGDIVEAVGDALAVEEGIVWIHIQNKNGDSGWVDLEYLEQN